MWSYILNLFAQDSIICWFDKPNYSWILLTRHEVDSANGNAQSKRSLNCSIMSDTIQHCYAPIYLLLKLDIID